MSEPSSRLARDRLHVNGSDLATKLPSLLAVTVGMLFIIFMFLGRDLEWVIIAIIRICNVVSHSPFKKTDNTLQSFRTRNEIHDHLFEGYFVNCRTQFE